MNPPMKKQIIMKANVHLEPFISSLPIKQSKMFELNLEFQLYNLENAAIRVHALYNSLLADPSYLPLTGVDAYVSSSLLPFLYNIAE